MKIKNKGFTGVEIILVIVVLGLLGFIGWRIYKTQIAPDTGKPSANTKPTSKEKKLPDSVITPGPGAEWSTYTNNKVGFSVKIPKRFLSGLGDPCEKVSYVYNRFGNKVSSKEHYIPEQGVVPATVVEDGDTFYITEKFTYQPKDKISQGDYTLAHNCQKVKTDSEIVNISEQSNPKYSLTKIPITVTEARNKQNIAAWAQKRFNDESISITEISKDIDGNWQNVRLTSKEHPMTFGFAYYLRFYKDQQRLVYIPLGNSVNLLAPESANADTLNDSYAYDKRIVESFKLIN